MSYRRNYVYGGTYFLTMCLADRNSTLLIDYIDELRLAYQQIQNKMPFVADAMVILPEHIHAVWTLPENDCDYSNRVRLFKGNFSRNLPKSLTATNNQSRKKKGELGIWQRRYWEHTIKNEKDFKQHIDYIHYNPVKHGLVNKPSDWVYSTIHKFIANGIYPDKWGYTNLKNGLNIDYD